MIPGIFPVPVPGVGDFTFRRRIMRDQVWIERDAIKTFGDTPPVQPLVPEKEEDWTEADRVAMVRWLGDASLWEMALAISTIERLVVASPPGWDIGNFDPLDKEQGKPILSVFRGLRAAESKFRQGPAVNSAEAGSGT